MGRGDGRVEDASFRLVGYVREGVIQDIKLKPVGFFEVGDFAGNADGALAACVFFIRRFSFRSRLGTPPVRGMGVEGDCVRGSKY